MAGSDNSPNTARWGPRPPWRLYLSFFCFSNFLGEGVMHAKEQLGMIPSGLMQRINMIGYTHTARARICIGTVSNDFVGLCQAVLFVLLHCVGRSSSRVEPALWPSRCRSQHRCQSVVVLTRACAWFTEKFPTGRAPQWILLFRTRLRGVSDASVY